jgi:hypothetical protein
MVDWKEPLMDWRLVGKMEVKMVVLKGCYSVE